MTFHDEIDLHRLTVDDALPLLEEFLYEAYQSGLKEVTVIHGKGTGKLKQEVRRYLGGHLLAQAFQEAAGARGGAGATAVRLIAD